MMGRVAFMREKRNACEGLVGNLEGSLCINMRIILK
jgi:hypothetical protein